MFASLPVNPVLRLKKNAKVLATQNIGENVKVGYFGQIISFVRDEGVSMDECLTARQLPYGITEDDVKEHYASVHAQHINSGLQMGVC